jgi:hypothetical protein
MKKRGHACGCIVRFLNQYSTLKPAELNGLRYEDDVCLVECHNGVIRAYSYEIINGSKYRNEECIATLW